MAVKSSFKNMVVCLSVICLVCSALLAAVYAITAEPVKAAAEAKLNKAISQVVPEFDSTPVESAVEVDGKTCKYYTVTKGGELAGYAIEASSSGFGGAISVMVGMTPDGVIYNTSVLSHSETPGLGAKCTDPAFADQFKGFDPSVKSLSVKKDKGDVDAITASTITSRAYCAALSNAVSAFKAIVQADSGSASGAADNVIPSEVGNSK